AASDQAKQDPEIAQRQQAMQAPQRQQFDMAAMDKYVTRTYYSDDLGLEVSSEPFDAMFLQSNPYIPFAETEGDGWLDGYVNNLRRDANARLAKLHYENLLIMRTRYLSIITDHCASITRSVSTDSPESRFGFTLAAIKKNKEDAIANLPATAEAYKKENEDAYQKGMRAAMDNAANQAQANYINQFYKRHEEEIRQIDTDLRNALEAEYVAAVENLNDERRAEAKRQLDAGISEALKLCKDEYTKMIAMERQEYARLQAVIVDYMNEHMAADEARVTTDMERLRRENAVAQANTEAAAAMERARVDFEAKLAAIRGESDKAAMEHENFVNSLRDQHAHIVAELNAAHMKEMGHKDEEIRLLNQQLEQADTRMEEMTHKFINLDSEIESKYRTQLEMVQSERDAWDERAHHLERLHKYTDKIKITSVAVGLVAALSVGIIIGCVIMAGSAQDAVDRQAEGLANQQAQEQLEQTPEYHYFINGEEVQLDGSDSQEGGQQDGQ
ncbi:MAG: hypothetical protein NC311_12540, partial [Muribaculaceae bacterium]|nr:hypothetical protein [Muribaculaceae bacterium]